MTVCIDNVPYWVNYHDVVGHISTYGQVLYVLIQQSHLYPGSQYVYVKMTWCRDEYYAVSMLNHNFWGMNKIYANYSAYEPNWFQSIPPIPSSSSYTPPRQSYPSSSEKPSSSSGSESGETITKILLGLGGIILLALAVGIPVQVIIAVPVIGIGTIFFIVNLGNS